MVSGILGFRLPPVQSVRAPQTTNGRELARIHIRRAEMLIWKARRKMDSLEKMSCLPEPKFSLSEDYLLIIVHIDEAWTALERGELGLGGNSHATYWWHRLIALKLSCYAALGDLHGKLEDGKIKRQLCATGTPSFEHCLPFRRRLHLPSTLMSLARDALIVGAGDDFRQLRIIDYILSVDKLIRKPGEKFFGDGEVAGLLFSKAPGGVALISDVVRVFYNDSNLGKHIAKPSLKNETGDVSKSIGQYTKKLWNRLPKAAQDGLEQQRMRM